MIGASMHMRRIAASTVQHSCFLKPSHLTTRPHSTAGKPPHDAVRTPCSVIQSTSGISHEEAHSMARSDAAGTMPPFHLAFPVNDLAAARDFYGRKLACPEGRSAPTWVDYSLFGHQIVCHHVAGYEAAKSANAVDGDAVPVPHFGLALSVPQFHELADRVRSAGIHFIIEPHIRFPGQPGEQWTMFFQDPSGNSLEFKAMSKPENLFAKYDVKC